jgi:hypothetical protein
VIALRIRLMRAAALIYLCATGISHAADSANYAPATPDGPAWLSRVAGAKLMAVDGSSITLSPSEGGLSLALMASDGRAQKSTFAFMSDRLGTISDDSDIGHVIGFFRETDAGIEAQFADGRTETLVLNAAGGITMTIRTSANETGCTSWYPADHVFGVADKRAALAAYADRLGIGDRKKAGHATAACAPAARIASAKDAAHKTPPLGTVSHPAMHPAMETPVKGSGDGALVPVAVRSSEVHPIDSAVVATAAEATNAVAAVPDVPKAAVPQLIQASVQQAAPAAQLPVPQNQPAAAVPAGRGASDCLSVETDGADVGFRNHCAYGVQFAYCLKKAGESPETCNAGAQSGAVAANGFAAVLRNAGIKSTGAEHDFRWVACSGNTNDVVAHLDRADPPAGRCVKANAS